MFLQDAMARLKSGNAGFVAAIQRRESRGSNSRLGRGSPQKPHTVILSQIPVFLPKSSSNRVVASSLFKELPVM